MRRGRELDDAVSAALAEVQARQESLSRGSVLPRAASPPAAAHGTSPPTLPKDKTHQRAALFQWLTRRVVRRSGLKDEDVGSLEFVPSASLATVRKLIEQFIALPPRREFVFAHPTTSARVESADEKHVAAAEFQFICIVLLPRRESTATSAVAAETEDLRLRPVTAQFQLQPTQQQTNARPRTVGTNANAKRAAEAATMTDVKVDIVPEKGIREPAQLIMEREKRTLENSAESKREDAPPSRAVGSKRIRGELRLELEDTASRNPERTVKVDPPIRKAVAKQVSTQRSRSASIRSVNEIESKATSEPTLVFPRFGDGCTEQADAQSKYLTPEAAQVYATEIATPESTQDAVDEIVLEQPVKVNIGAENVTSEVQTEKMISQKPGPLRRSRRFRSASIAKLAEIDWGALETEQEEVATDEQVEELIEVIVEAFYTRLPGVDPRQVDAACRYYGIDYQALELQGVLLALDNELGMRCNHVRGGVDGQLTQYLLKKLPVNVDNMQDPEALRHFEHALNLFAGMRGWQAPSRLRATCFEDKQRLQLIASSDTRRFSLLRLSDKDRQLFTLASTGSSAGGLEKWLGDGLEITYVLLYGFLQSRRNSGPKSVAKLDAIFIRQDRIQAAIQKLSCFSLEVWKRLELRTTDIEDVSMVRRLDELLKGFVRDSELHSGEIEGSVFFPAIVGYLIRKSDQLAQSLAGLVNSTHGVRGPLHSCVAECVRLLRQQLEHQAVHSTTAEAHLLNSGLKIIDVEKINASRTRSGLGRIYMSGKESILTHHQCKMMARDKYLHLKARWELGDLSWGKTSRYFFVEAKDIALEYVFVRMNPDHNFDDDMRGEDRELLSRKEAQYAFNLLCGDSLDIPLDVSIGVGINILHTDLLPHISSLLSLSTVLREYPETTSVSFGYCYAPATQITRVVFRVHADAYKGRGRDNDDGIVDRWRLPSVIKEVDKFLASAHNDETIAFCNSEGLSFLHSCLQDEDTQWRAIMFGLPFFETIYPEGNKMCQTEDILKAMKQTMTMIPRALESITKKNIQIILNLVEKLSDIGDEAINAILSICSNVHQPVSTGPRAPFSVLPMTETQKTFSMQGGLEFLIAAAQKLHNSPARKESIENAIVNLLRAQEFSLRSGLLVHWREWLEFYVERRAWSTNAATPAFSVFLLSQIHTQFFTSRAFGEPTVETCTCGCQVQSADVIDSCVGVMEIFVRLMVTEVGVTWAQEEMKGPEACVSFLLWSVDSRQDVPRMAELQSLILKSLCDFIERMTSSHQYLRLLSSLTPRLLCLLKQQDCPSLHTESLRVLSLTFRLAVDKKVWSISMEPFLAEFYRIIESICENPSLSHLNDIMVSVILKSNYPQPSSCVPTSMLSLLHEEHVNFVGGSGQLSPVARSRSKSLLQTLVSFCSLTWNSVLQPFCQIPAIISLGWMLSSHDIAEDLAQLELDDLLLTLIENDSTVVSILAIRSFVVLLFQGLSSRRVVDEYRLKRLCNFLTTALGSGTRLMLSPKRGGDVENLEEIQFAANEHELFLILLRYSVFNNEQQSRIYQRELEQEDSHEIEQSPIQVIWDGSEWGDANRAGAEKLAANLKMLTVFSSMTTNVVSIGHSDEIRQIIVLLVQFIRERAHTASQHITLYLLSLRNIVWATRSDLAKWGYLDLTEASFLRKLLLLSMDRVHQDLASGILWGLADAYEKTNILLLSFEVDDSLTKGSYFPKKTGFAVMIDNLASKIASGRSAESDSGALASMIANPIAADIFISNYGYSFVLKLIDSTLRSTITGHNVGLVPAKAVDDQTSEVFGTTLFYTSPIKYQKDRDLLQLCRSATKSLEIMQRSNAESILDEAARTRATILPLLTHPNKQIAIHAIWCCSSHLQTHPTKCGKLFDSDVQDKVMAYFFEAEYPPIQAAAFSCMKLALADQKSLMILQAKLSPIRERIVSCLRSPHFQVKRKATVFLVEATFRLDDQRFLDEVADAFAAPGNQGILLELFDSLSKELELNPAAGGVLQLLVRLILRLDLVVHTDGDQLVHGICLTLKVHSTDTFVRPTLFNCLHQIVTQDDRVAFLSMKSRLDAITDLLSQQLTLSELRNIAGMLVFVASKHSGIRHYLSGFTSGCITKVASVLDGFSEYAQGYDTTKDSRHLQNATVLTSKDDEGEKEPPAIPPEPSTSFLLKVTTTKVVYISHFTEDVYEQFLRLLLLLLKGPEFNLEERYGCLCEGGGCCSCDPCDIVAKTRCGHLILHLVAAHRISYATYDLAYLLSTTGVVSTTILNLCIEVLEVIAANYQSRVQMLRDASKMEWSWIPYLVKPAMFSECHAGASGELSACETDVVLPILLLGCLSAAKEVAQRLVADRQLVSLLFSYVSPGDSLFAPNVRRVASFTLARLAEHSSVVRDAFFQESMATLTHSALFPDEVDDVHREQDKLVLANKMVLCRNRALLTPGLQGRSADEGTLTALVGLLSLSKATEASSSDFDIGLIGADVLSHLLYFRVNVRHETRLRSVLWRYTRTMSPTKPVEDQIQPSSKRLIAYLHNWIGPMLQKLRKSVFGVSRSDLLQLLHDELVYTYQQLHEPSVCELLLALVSLHLQHTFRETSVEVNATTMAISDEMDVLMPFEYDLVQRTRQQYLLYAFSESDRSTREPNDYSFHGSAHLWLFLRKLWDLCVGSDVKEIVQVLEVNIPHILARWKRERDTGFSTSAFDRRQCFLEFLIAVGETESGLLSVIDVKTVVEIVVGNGLDPGVSLGAEYKLLCLVCHHFPENVEVIRKWFNLDCGNDHEHTPTNPFCPFWSRVRLHQLPVKLSSSVTTKITILDPSPDADLATIFGVDLLRRLSSRSPQVVQWYAQCQGYTELLDMVLLASRIPALQMAHILVRTFLSNLLYLVNHLVEQDQDRYYRILTVDPRYLRCIVDLIYAPAYQVQTAAIKLVQRLAQQPQLSVMLSRIENLVQPLGIVNADFAIYIGEILNRRQVSPPFTHDRLMVLAHIWYVPFFTDLSITELVKLSLGFNLCTQPTENAWVLLTNDNQFSAIPEWMFESNASGYNTFTSAMKRVQKRFEGAMNNGKHRLAMYSIAKEAYFNVTTVSTRRRIALRLSNLLKTYNDDANMYRGSIRVRNGLVMRLGRLLVEDRAEIIRRVAYTKRISERVLFEQMQRQQLSDLLSLLQEAPLFEGIQRDHLANLAFRMGGPVEVMVDTLTSKQNLPLLVLFDEGVEFEMYVRNQIVLQGTASRGGLLGFPSWLENKPESEDYNTVVRKCGVLGIIISRDLLKVELTEPAFSLVDERLRSAFNLGDTQRLSQLMVLQDDFSMQMPARRRLQCSASSLLVQLVRSDVFINNLLHDSWAIRIIVDIALAALPADVVLNALNIVVVMTINEAYAKQFWTKASPTESDQQSGKAKSHTLTPIMLVAELVNRFKLRLWLSHPAILKAFFLIQSQVARYLPAFWPNLDGIWTTQYLRGCLDLLHSGQHEVADVVGSHLSGAIPHRMDYLTHCCQTVGLHLELAQILAKTRCGSVVGLLRLLIAFCLDEVLRENIWESVVNSPQRLDGVLRLVATGISHAFDTGNADDVEIYCSFINLVCTSGINELLDSEFRSRIGNRFGILSTLLTKLQTFPTVHMNLLILRCVGGICIDTPSNSSLAVTTVIESKGEQGGAFLIDIIAKLLTELDECLRTNGYADPLMVEATFSCIEAITSVPGHMERFNASVLVAVALHIILSFTTTTQVSPSPTTSALQSVVRSMDRTLCSMREIYVDAFSEANISILIVTYERISTQFSAAVDNMQLLQLLKEYTGLLSSLLSSEKGCDALWTTCLRKSDLINQFVTWIYHWIVFDASKSPDLVALNSNRIQKRLRLLEATTRMQHTAVALVTMLSAHEELSAILSFHPDFGKVIEYIFAAFQDSNFDVERATVSIKFICFIAEQWGEREMFQQRLASQHRIEEVHDFRQHFDAQALLKACYNIQAHSDTFVCYAMRFMWLLVKVNSYSIDTDSKVSEYHDVLPLATEILKSPSSSTRTRCNVIGLMAELSVGQAFLPSNPNIASSLIDVVRSALTMLTHNSLRISRETIASVSLNLSDDYLSSRNWHCTDDQESSLNELRFGIIHQTRRFVLYLCKTPEIRTILFDTPCFHPLLRRTLFVDSIGILRASGTNEVLTKAHVDGLQLIAILLGCTTSADLEVAKDFRAYSLIARREGCLRHCIRLLSEPQVVTFQHAILESVLSYVSRNICASVEVVTLREQENEDLMGVLLSIASTDTDMEGWVFSSASQLCLRVYNLLIEFSFSNAAYAAKPSNIDVLIKLREIAERRGALLDSDIPRTLLYIARMLGSSKLSADVNIFEEIWEMVSTVLLHPQISSYLETLEYALEMLWILAGSRIKSLEFVLRDWERRGRLVVLHLIDLVLSNSISNNGVGDDSSSTTSQLALKVLTHACVSETFREYVNTDSDIVFKLVSEYPWSNHQTQLLNFLLKCGHTKQQNSLLSQQIVVKRDEIVLLTCDYQLPLLELLPSLLPSLRSSEHILLNILCILEEIMHHEDQSKLVTVARALWGVLEHCDFRTVSKKMVMDFQVVLTRLLSISKSNSSATLIRLDEPNTILMPSTLELLLLVSLYKLSYFVGTDLQLVNQRASPYLSMWMSISVSRLCNFDDDEGEHLLSVLVFYYLDVNAKTESNKKLLNSRHYWRSLTRKFASIPTGAIRHTISKLMLQLLQSSPSQEFVIFVTDSLGLDLIDILRWEVSSTSQEPENDSGERRALWCSLLDELCRCRDDAISIMEKGFLEQFIRQEHLQMSAENVEQPATTKLLCLLSSVCQVTTPRDHELFLQQQQPLTMEILTELCVNAIAAISGSSDAKWNAAEVLYVLSMNGATLSGIWKAFCLEERENTEPTKGRERMCAISEMLLLCQKDIGDLVLIVTLILKVFGSSKSMAVLIHARNVSDCWPMIDVLVEVLEQCTSSMNRSNLRPIQLATCDPSEFLPYHQSSDLHAKATILTLQVVQLCAANQPFAESLKAETDLLHKLFVCLATSVWEISSSAATTLITITRCSWGLNHGEDATADISRYNCEYGVYKKLDFFASLSSQNVFSMSPPSSFPSCFVLLVRWIRFYSVNLPLLGGTQLVLPVDKTEDDLMVVQDPEFHDLHEALVISVLELLLYCVSNFHSEMYKNDNSDEEQREHSLLLQSLLALCQRRSNKVEGSFDFFADTCTVANGIIRSRSLELVQLLCSLDLPHTSSVEVFANPRQMLILMMMVERSSSSIEQCAATQLMEALALHHPIKTLLIGNSSLLSRLGAWLESDMLDLLAAAIIQRLATPSSKRQLVAGNSVFGFVPSMQQQLAHFLFVERQPAVKKMLCLPPSRLLNETRLMRFNIQLKQVSKGSPRLSSSAWPMSVLLNFEVLDKNKKRIRAFQYTGTLHNGHDFIEYELLIEPTVNAIRCCVVGCNASERTESKHFLELPLLGPSSILNHNDTLTIRCEEEPMTNYRSLSLGILPRLLRQEYGALNAELFYGLAGIIGEFCKNFDLFCDPVIDLPAQVLIVLGTSVTFSPDNRMYITCMEALTTWFPRKPTISFFKKSIFPLLHLIQGLRRLSCVKEYINRNDQSNETEGAMRNSKQVNYASNPSPVQFLEKLIEMIASVDAPDLTANCLNMIFLDNTDALLYLCAQFHPEQDPNATFLSLVAIAIRSNVVHCQTFLTQNAQTLLHSVLDAGIEHCAGQSEQLFGSLLSFASLVTVRLARCPITNHGGMNGTDRLELFSRVSFEVFVRHWQVEWLPSEAAENLILACGFFTDGLSKFVAVDANTREAEWVSALSTDRSTQEDRLTIVETLLLFLGHPASDEKTFVSKIDGQMAFDSFDRLAACVLASLVEKLPDRGTFEQTLLQLVNARSSRSYPSNTGKSYEEQCLLGLRRCLGLTRYDFQSELNVLRLTYYSSIRAGVRTGIIPPQCSGAFQRFDQEHLLPTGKPQWHLDEIGGNGLRQSFVQRTSDERPVISSNKNLLTEDSRLESELRELLLFTTDHSEILSVLTVNRKKAMTAAIRIATRNARILVAFHAMASIALDFYIDTAKRLQNQKKRGQIKSNEPFAQRVSATPFLEWLLLLEELAGLLCSGLHELDASYYVEIARQFRSLIVDLPMFLRKMERAGAHSRQQALMLFLDNLHRLLKRATNRNELRVVAASGTGVADQTKRVRERLRCLDPQISASLGVLLGTPEGMENLSRALVAMTYVWRRMMGATSLDKAMATSKESVSLLKKITEKLVGIFQALCRPKKLVRAVFLIVFRLGIRQQNAKSLRFDSPSAHQSSRFDSNSGNTDQSQSGSDRDPAPLAYLNHDKLLSRLPFSSLELALDHFGWESLSAKRTKQLLQQAARKNMVAEVLSVALGISEESVDRLSVLELAEHFHNLDVAKTMPDVLARLEALAFEDEMPFTALPSVVHDRMDMSLWRLMVRPIQRVRLFHLYQQVQRFVTGDQARRQRLLEGSLHTSPQKPALFRESPSKLKAGAEMLAQHPTSRSTRLFLASQENRLIADQGKQEEPLLSAQAAGVSIPAAKVVIPQSALSVCDGILSRDPLSDDAAMRFLRKKNESLAKEHHPWTWLTESQRLAQYRTERQRNAADWALRVAISLSARLVLMIAFWRQEELRTDLKDPIMARAFDDLRARDEYYRLYHARKGLGELFRVWMPSSGRLGLLLWQERRYALGGTLLSVVMALWLPTLVFPTATSDDQASTAASERNTFMTRIVYSYGIAIFILSVVSIALIARNRFVLLEQSRLRLRPISRYYQNALAVTAIAVELVQLNSLAFDPAVDWDDTDELPGFIQWLGRQGITRFGVSSASELQAMGILLLLLSWFLLLKCANKFQDTSVLLHRVLTKDLPALVNGFFYMGTISAFFSFLACVDCSTLHHSTVKKCVSAPQAPPFLIAHPSISCWTAAHQWYALLGLWGITFFLPIGLLAHGMSQVLFQRETLDIKYAPVLLLVTQLVKAVAATAQAFFPFEPLVLASLGFIGNGVLLALTLAMHSCSLWYIKYVKCSVYAASCWASLGAVHRLHNAGESSTRSLNMIYLGWLSIGLATATAILWRVWRHARAKQREDELRFAAQQRLLNAGSSAGTLGAVGQKFMKAAKKHSHDAFTRAVFVSNATRLSASAPPPALKDFMARAEEVRSCSDAQSGLFMQNARSLATKLQEQEGLRRRR